MTSKTAPWGSPPPSLRPSSAARGGFTLVEILITIVVIAFGCLAALTMQSAALRGNTMAEHMTIATFLTESELERLKSLTYEEVNAEIADKGTYIQWFSDRFCKVCPSATAAACPDYPYEVSLRFYQKYPTNFSNMAEVKVSWTDNTGRHTVVNAATLTDLTF
jgi:prepilin-type N-terminal cleavage/methylation domain-containing protein